MTALTPVGFLLLRALEAGKTSCGEGSKSCQLSPRSGETVLVFRTDSAEFREKFGLGVDGKASDAMVLYIQPELERHALFFVEFKGKKYEEAIDQLKQVISAVRSTLSKLLGHHFFERAHKHAIIVSDRGAPLHFDKKAEERFVKETGVPLHTEPKGNADLRTILDGKSNKKKRNR